MELVEGYKKTEIGLIPSDWNLISFEKAFKYLSTATYSRADADNSGEVKYVHYGDIHTKWNHLLDFKTASVSKVTVEQAKGYSLIEEGDLIMADASEDYEGIGKCVEVVNLKGNKAISGLHTFLLRPHEGIFGKGYPAYLHSSKLIKKQFDKLATGLKVYGVSKTNLKKVLIPLPSNIEEQQSIVAVLSDANKLIHALDRKIRKKRLIKEGAIQRLMVPREDWELKKLFEITEVIVDNRGKTPPNSSDGDVELIETASISFVNRYPDYEKAIKYVSSQTYNKWFRKHPKANDLLISTVGEYSGASAILKDNRGTIAQNLISIRLKKVNSMFVFYWTRSLSYSKQLNQVMMNQAQPSLRVPWLLNFDVPIPSLSIQNDVVAILSSLDDEIESLESKLSKVRKLKQGVMHQLLTGKIRLV